MRLISINIGTAQSIGVRAGEIVHSAIGKRPLGKLSVFVGRLGLAGDIQADKSVHGGVDKAVYAYPLDHAAFWQQHGVEQAPGTFGENLTLEGLDEETVAIGDRFRVGEALLEVSEPRGPCYKLDMHLRTGAAGLMTISGRCGFYLRVIEEGVLPADGAKCSRETRSDGPNVRETFLARHGRVPDEALARIHASPALGEGWRRAIAKLLEKRGIPGIESADSRV